jgi:hypothetical protein
LRKKPTYKFQLIQKRYVHILFKHQDVISIIKFDLGQAKNFSHKIHLKNNDPVYRKQFKIPEAHQSIIEAFLDEWLKLGVVKRSNSFYNSPLFCVPKETRPWVENCSKFQITQCKFSQWHDWPYFWLLANEAGQSLSTFKSYHNTRSRTISMGHLSNGATRLSSKFPKTHGNSFKKHQKSYHFIDDLLVHTATHQDHLVVLEKVFERLHTNHLKINLEKFVFGNQEVSP